MRRRGLACALLIAAWAALAAAGCYRPMMQRAYEARELYREGDFTLEMLDQGGVTFLATRVSFGDETYGVMLLQGLVDTISGYLSLGQVVHPNLVAGLINQAGLSREYAAMLDEYDETSILEIELLRKISEVAGVRYFCVPILVKFAEGMKGRFSVFSVKMGQTAVAHARFHLQIWDGHTGRIAWEGYSDLTLAQETMRENPVRIEEIVNATWQSLIEQIPREADAT